MRSGSAAAVAVVALAVVLAVAPADARTFHLGFMGPSDVPSSVALSDLGMEWEAAFKIAVDLANSDAAFPDIDFTFATANTAADAATAVAAAVNLRDVENVDIVIGCALSSVTEAVYPTFAGNTPMLSYASTSAALTKASYPDLWRVVPNDNSQAAALGAVARGHSWDNVGIIGTDDSYADGLADAFFTDFSATSTAVANVRVPFGSNVDEFEDGLAALVRGGSAITMASMVTNDLETFLDGAIDHNLVGAGRVILGSDGVTASPLSGAGLLAYRQALQGALGTSVKSGAGQAYADFLADWEQRDPSTFPGIIHASEFREASAFAAQIADAVYAVAHALQSMHDVSPAFTLTPTTLGAEFSTLSFPSFTDITFSFDADQDGPVAYDVLNLQGSSWRLTGSYTTGGGYEEDAEIVWPGGSLTAPTDVPPTTGKITYTLGVVTPTDPSLAGVLADLGHEWKAAFEIAAMMVTNDQDLKVQFETVSCASNGTTASGVACGNALVAAGVDGVVGAALSGVTEGLISVCAPAQIPVVSYASTAESLSGQSFFFRTVPSDNEQGVALSNIARNMSWARAGIIATSDVYAGPLASRFANIFETEGGHVLVDARFERGSSIGSSSFLAAWNNFAADAGSVNLISTVTDDAEVVFQQSLDTGFSATEHVWLGTDGSTSIDFTSVPALAASVSGMIGTQPKLGEGSVFNDFLAVWELQDPANFPGLIHGAVDRRAAVFSAQIYNAVYAFAHAIDRLIDDGTDVSGSTINTALAGINSVGTGFIGATGNAVFFDGDGNGPADYDVVNLVGDRWQEVGTVMDGSFVQTSLIVWPGGQLSNVYTPPDTLARQVVKLGFIGPTGMSLGSLGALGREREAAFKIAIDIVNNDPQYGVTFTYETADTGGNPTTGAAAAEALIMNGARAIVGPALSSVSLEVQKVCAMHSVPCMSYSSTSSALSSGTGDGAWFFRVVPTDEYQGRALADLARYYSFIEAASISTDDAYAAPLALTFAEEFEARGGSIKARVQFPKSADLAGLTSEAEEAVEAIRESGSVVNVISAVAHDTELAFQYIMDKGMDTPLWTWLGVDGSTAETFATQPAGSGLEEAMQGMLGTQPQGGFGALYFELLADWELRDPATFPGVIHTVEEQTSSTYAAQTADAVYGFAHAITRLIDADSVITGESMRNQLVLMADTATGYDGTTGRIYFDINGDRGTHFYDVVNLEGRTWNQVGTWSDLRATGEEYVPLDGVDVLWKGGTTVVPTPKRSFHVGFIGPTGDDLGSTGVVGREWQSAFEVAASLINMDASRSVRISYTTADSAATPEGGRAAAQDLLDAGVVAVVGPGLSSVATTVSKDVLGPAGVPQVSYSATSAALSDKSEYPLFHRVCPSDMYQGDALARLVEEFDWTQVGVVATDDDYADGLATIFEDEFAAGGGLVTAATRFPINGFLDQAEEAVHGLKGGSAVNAVVAVAHDAELVFTAAMAEGMTGAGWGWLGTDGSTSSTFEDAALRELELAMQGMVGTQPATGTGRMYDDFLAHWQLQDPDDFPGIVHAANVPASTVFTAQAHDALLAIVVAIEKAIAAGTDAPTAADIHASLRTMDSASNGFTGLTGPVYFDSTQDGPPAYAVVNLQGKSWRTVGTWRASGGGFEMTEDIRWPGGSINPPSDLLVDPTAAPIPNDDKYLAAIIIMAMACILITCVCSFLIYREYRGDPLVKGQQLGDDEDMNVPVGNRNRERDDPETAAAAATTTSAAAARASSKPARVPDVRLETRRRGGSDSSSSSPLDYVATPTRHRTERSQPKREPQRSGRKRRDRRRDFDSQSSSDAPTRM